MKVSGDTSRTGPRVQSTLALLDDGSSQGDPQGSALRARWILDELTSLVALVHPRGVILDVNAEAQRLGGLARASLVGRHLGDVEAWFIPRDRRRIHEAVGRAALGHSVRVEVEFATRDGDRAIQMEVALRPVRDRRSRVTLILVEGRDVTALRGAQHAVERQNDALRELADRLEEADARRRRFVADVSHELKTPLSIMLGLVGRALATGGLSPGARRDSEGVQRHALAMLAQVEELLLAARLEEHGLELAADDCDLARVVHEVAAGFGGLAVDQDIHLEVVTPEHVEAHVDATRMATVVSNLVANALRFTPPAGAVRVTLADVGDGLLRLEVADSGPGVPEPLRARVFERFRQAGEGEGEGEAETTDAHAPAEQAGARKSGTGLGLSIVREIVALHGGQVSIGEAPEGGALVRVELPRGTPAPEGPGAPVRSSFGELLRPVVERVQLQLLAGGGHAALPAPATDDRPVVLVAGPDPRLGAPLEQALGAHYAIRRAASTDEALVAVTQQTPAAVVADVELPGGCGGEGLLDVLRHHERLDDVPVLLVHDGADADRTVRLLRGGAQDVLAGAWEPDEVAARLDAALARRARDAERAHAAGTAHAAFDQAPVGMAVLDPAGRCTRVNSALCAMLGCLDRDLVGTSLDAVTHPDDVGIEGDLLAQARDGLVRGFQIEKRLRGLDGSYRWALLSVSPLAGGTAGQQGLVVHVDDVTERRNTEERLRRQVGSDELTGLPRRPRLASALRRRAAAGARSGRPTAVVLLDLDGLAAVNATHGIAVGDRLLRAVARAVQRRLGDAALVARTGGDELGAVATGADAVTARRLAEEALDAVRRTSVSTPGGPVTITASAGVAVAGNGRSAEQALAAAGLAVRRAARRGGDHVVVAPTTPG